MFLFLCTSRSVNKHFIVRFILMLEEGDSEKAAMYEEWIRVYDMSIRECHNNNKEEEAVTEDEEEWYRTSVARISGSQALSLLHQYLQKITVDRFTRLTPAWTLKVLPFNTFTDTDFMVYYSEKKRVK